MNRRDAVATINDSGRRIAQEYGITVIKTTSISSNSSEKAL